MRFSKDTINQAFELIEQMRRSNVETFHIDIFGLNARNEINYLVQMAKRYHTIQEHDCNGTKTAKMESLERNLEKRMTDIATRFNLKIHFDGDPRGYCVKLHAPKMNVYNTWGGAEIGYGIG